MKRIANHISPFLTAVNRPATRRPALGLLVGALAMSPACMIEDDYGDDYGARGPGSDELIDKTQDEVVYGTDNRLDVYEHPDASLRARAQQATVALMSPSDFNATNPDNVTFNGSTLEVAFDLCSTERFLDDPTSAFCSGTLIDDDLVLTAGHCVTNSSDCNGTRFVFNYYRDSATTLQTVTTADIFSCSQIVAREQRTVGGQTLDYAVIRLDRAATPRFTPAPVRTGNTALSSGQNVAVIGSGSGVPFKIDAGGSVRDARASVLDYFVASTDTFGGNSGSGVYETNSYTVAGILVRGETDYKANGSCNVVNTCTESGCGGEEITYVHPAIQAYCNVATSTRLCSDVPPPPPPPADSFSYSATNTNSAQQNTTNQVVALQAGDTIKLGTCGITGAAFTDDTYLRFRTSGGVEVASNDDACGGRGSQLTYTVPAGAGGNYVIAGGCYSSTSCTGTVVWEVTPGSGGGNGSFDFSATNTNSAQKNTVNHDVVLSEGQTLQVGTCTVPGASGTGDTFIRVFNGATQVDFNDDGSGCGVLSFTSLNASQSGTYQIRAGCYSNQSCSGTVAYTIQ